MTALATQKLVASHHIISGSSCMEVQRLRESGTPFTLRFTTDCGDKEVQVTITEDMSGATFQFMGTTMRNGETHTCTGYYNPVTGKGYINVLS